MCRRSRWQTTWIGKWRRGTRRTWRSSQRATLGDDRAQVNPREIMGSVWCVPASTQNLGTFRHKKKKVGQIGLSRCRQREAKWHCRAVANAPSLNWEKSGDSAHYLEVLLGIGKHSVWTGAKVRERHTEVEQEDEGRQIFVRAILRKARTSRGGSSCQSTVKEAYLVVRMPSLPPTPA